MTFAWKAYLRSRLASPDTPNSEEVINDVTTVVKRFREVLVGDLSTSHNAARADKILGKTGEFQTNCKAAQKKLKSFLKGKAGTSDEISTEPAVEEKRSKKRPIEDVETVEIVDAEAPPPPKKKKTT